MEEKRYNKSTIVMLILLFILTTLTIKSLENKNKEYKILKNSISKEGLLYKLPYRFKEIGKNSHYYKYNNECYFKINEYNKYLYKSLEDCLENNYLIKLKEFDINETKINNLNLLHLNKISNYTLEDYYAIEGNEKYYVIYFEVNAKEDNDYCYTAKNELLSSIKIEKGE